MELCFGMSVFQEHRVNFGECCGSSAVLKFPFCLDQRVHCKLFLPIKPETRDSFIDTSFSMSVCVSSPISLKSVVECLTFFLSFLRHFVQM